MTSLQLDWAASQIEDQDATEQTQDDEEKDATEQTQDDEVKFSDATDSTQDKFLDADHTDETQEKFLDADSTDGTSDKFADRKGAWAISKIPSSEIVVRTITVDRSAPLAALPADSDAAYSQWLSNSGLAPSRH